MAIRSIFSRPEVAPEKRDDKYAMIKCCICYTPILQVTTETEYTIRNMTLITICRDCWVKDQRFKKQIQKLQ